MKTEITYNYNCAYGAPKLNEVVDYDGSFSDETFDYDVANMLVKWSTIKGLKNNTSYECGYEEDSDTMYFVIYDSDNDIVATLTDIEITIPQLHIIYKL